MLLRNGRGRAPPHTLPSLARRSRRCGRALSRRRARGPRRARRARGIARGRIRGCLRPVRRQVLTIPAQATAFVSELSPQERRLAQEGATYSCFWTLLCCSSVCSSSRFLAPRNCSKMPIVRTSLPAIDFGSRPWDQQRTFELKLKCTNMNGASWVLDSGTSVLGQQKVSGTARGGSHESLGVLELLRCVLILRAHLLRLRPAPHRALIPRAHHHLRRPHSLLLLLHTVVQAVDGVLADLLDEVSGVGLQHFGLEHFDVPDAC